MADQGHSSRPDADCKRWNVDSIHAHFERWLLNMEKHYDARLSEIKEATATALIAVEKQTNAAFAANKESVTKTEEGQRAYNAQHNDLTRKMEAQAARFVDRERLDDYEKRFDTKLESLKADIGRLQQGNAAGTERRVTQSEHRQQSNWTVTNVISVIFGLAGMLTFILAWVQFFLKARVP